MEQGIEQTFPTEYVEKLILNRLLLDATLLNSIDRMMSDGIIGDPMVSDVIGLVRAYFKRYDRVPDANTLSLLLGKFCEKNSKDAAQYKALMDEVFTMVVPSEADAIKDNILALIKQKTFIRDMVAVTNKLAKDKLGLVSVNEQMRIIQNALEMRFDTVAGMDYRRDIDEHFEVIRKPDSHISTGYHSLDYVMNGGVPNVENQRWLGCVMGQANIGKSLWLGSLAYQALCADKKVLIVSCEMSRHMYARRMDALISGDNIDLMHTTQIKPEVKIKRFFDEEHKNAQLFIEEFAANTASCTDIADKIELYDRLGTHPDFVFVDYLNLLRPRTQEKGELLPFIIKRICEELRNLSLTHNVKIWTATQVNGDGIDNADMNIGMTSGSKGIGMTVDAMFGVWRSKDDKDANLTHLQVIKNRDGHVGETIMFTQDPSTLLIKECSSPGFADGDAPVRMSGGDSFDEFGNM